MSNAARYSLGYKKVTLSVIEKEDFLTFTVWNNGPAFTKEAVEKMKAEATSEKFESKSKIQDVRPVSIDDEVLGR